MQQNDNITIYGVNLVMGSIQSTEFLQYFAEFQNNIIGLLQMVIGVMGVYYTYKNNRKNKQKNN
jgi:glucose uptake protein GlcU